MPSPAAPPPVLSAMSASTMGPPRGGERARHRLLHGQRGVDELVAMLPRHARERLGVPLGQRLVVVGGDVDAEPGVGNVGEREAGEDGDGDDARVALHPIREVVEPPHRAARRPLVAERGQERRLAEGGGGADAARRSPRAVARLASAPRSAMSTCG